MSRWPEMELMGGQMEIDVGARVLPVDWESVKDVAHQGKVRSVRSVRGRPVCLVEHDCGRLRNWFTDDLQLADPEGSVDASLDGIGFVKQQRRERLERR